MQITVEQRAVLAHVVLEPDAWVAHAVSVLGEDKALEAVIKKVSRWQKSYDLAISQGGYLPRAQRQNQEPAVE